MTFCVSHFRAAHLAFFHQFGFGRASLLDVGRFHVNEDHDRLLVGHGTRLRGILKGFHGRIPSKAVTIPDQQTHGTHTLLEACP